MSDVVIIDGVNIGTYKLNEVRVLIIDGGSLLLGTGMLNAFSSWEIKSSQEILSVTK